MEVRHRAASSSSHRECPESSSLICQTPLEWLIQVIRTLPSCKCFSRARLTTPPQLAWGSGCLFLFINAISKIKSTFYSLTNNYSFQEARWADFCKAEIIPPNAMGLLAMKLHQILRGRAKESYLSTSGEIKSMVNNIKILFYKAEYLNSMKLFSQGQITARVHNWSLREIMEFTREILKKPKYMNHAKCPSTDYKTRCKGIINLLLDRVVQRGRDAKNPFSTQWMPKSWYIYIYIDIKFFFFWLRLKTNQLHLEVLVCSCPSDIWFEHHLLVSANCWNYKCWFQNPLSSLGWPSFGLY